MVVAKAKRATLVAGIIAGNDVRILGQMYGLNYKKRRS